MTLVRLIITVLIIVTPKVMNAQSNIPLLDRKVSVSFTNFSLKEALFELSKLGPFNISYNSEILPKNRLTNFTCNQKKISEILPQILPSDITFKNVGNNVILVNKMNKKSNIVIKGNIYDSIIKINISDATILDVLGSNSVISDSLGNFVIEFTHKQKELILNISRVGYNDTIMYLQPISQAVKINLTKTIVIEEVPINKIELQRLVTIDNYLITQLVTPEELLINTLNIHSYSKRKFQFSFTPGTSTNLKIAGLVKNEVSINVIGGYNYGVGKIEIGGAFNINRSNVSGFQIAGFSNLVGGDINGLQIAGALNRTKGYQNGLQIAGFGNFNSANYQER